MRIMARFILALLCAGYAFAQTPIASGYVGSNVCRTCHADIWLNFYKNPHYKSIASGKESPERTGCEGCHGPAQAHVAAGGGKDTIPRAFSLMTTEAGAGHLSHLPCGRRLQGQHPPLGTHSERRGLHQLPLDSPLPDAQISARQEAERAVLHLPRHCAGAIRDALQAPRERRLRAMHGLPQSARRFRGHLAQCAAAAHGGAGAGQRGRLPQMPCRQARALCL